MSSPSSPTSSAPPIAVPVYANVTREDFLTSIVASRKPAIVRGAELGECVRKWTPSYLRSKGRGKRVIVHRGNSARMDFVGKNFKYVEMDFDEFVGRAAGKEEEEEEEEAEKNGGEHPSSSQSPLDVDQKSNPSSCEYFYLRSLGADPRRDVSDIHAGFPELAPDLTLPPFVPVGAFFSSVFRIASPGMQLWTHYDVMDNILIQIRGEKRVVLFPPSDANFLYLKGDKSLVLDVDSPDLSTFPLFVRATRHECRLRAGDVLFIPALWFHNVVSLDFGVAVNAFWRHLPVSAYDPKDVYGNRDPVPAARALQSLDKSIAQLREKLPAEYADFYLRRMMARIEERLGESGEGNL